MKIKQLLSITALLGLSLIPVPPSHSQPSNPCKLAPFAMPSKETRLIRVEKFGVAFNIPENYRTRSNITENNMAIEVYDPSGFNYYECLVINRVPSDLESGLARVSIDKVNTLSSLSELIDYYYNQSRQGTKIIRNLTFANQPAITLRYGIAYSNYVGLIFLSSNKKYLVGISYMPESYYSAAEKINETIKSSFTFINQ